MKKTITLFIGFFLFTVLFVPFTLWAAPYFKDKRITYTVGSQPGGGYDLIARLYAKYLTKYIPGEPIVIVSNMPGATGMVCANHIFSIAKPDGLTIGAFQKGNVYGQLLKAAGVRYDLRKFSWIGSTAVEATALVIRNDLPYKTFSDIVKMKPDVMLGNTGPTEIGSAFSMLLNDFAGVNFKLVTYPGSSAAMLAVERKEVDGRAGSYSSLKSYIDRGLVHPVVRGPLSEPETEAVPSAEGFISDPKGKTFLSIILNPDRVGRPTVLPPGTPADIVNTLREAFAKVSQDPAFREDAAKNNASGRFVPGDECLKIIDFILGQPEDITKGIAKYNKY